MTDKAVNQTRNSKVRQSGRVVTAARRQSTAREKARISGKKTRRPSALEQSAVEWQKEQETRTRKVEEAKLGTPRVGEERSFSLQPMSFQPDKTQLPEDDVVWKIYDQRPQKKKDTGNRDTGKPNTAMLFAISRYLMAIEKAGALGRKPVDPRTRALELEARRWTEESARRKNK